MRKIVGWVILVIILIILIWAVVAVFGWMKNKVTGGGDAGVQKEQAAQVESVDVVKAARGVKDEYKDDVEFQQCFVRNVDTCLNEVINRKQQDGQVADITLCDDFLSDAARTNCRFSLTLNKAMKSTNPADCAALVNADYRATCEFEAVMQSGLTNKDLAVCDKVGEKKPECLNRLVPRIAEMNSDPAVCDELVVGGDEEGFVASTVEDCKGRVSRLIEDRKRSEAEQAEAIAAAKKADEEAQRAAEAAARAAEQAALEEVRAPAEEEQVAPEAGDNANQES